MQEAERTETDEELAAPDVPETVPDEEIRDPDLATARELAVGSPEDTDAQVTDDLLPEERLVEFEPPDQPTPTLEQRRTGEDEAAGETLDERLPQERDEP